MRKGGGRPDWYKWPVRPRRIVLLVIVLALGVAAVLASQGSFESYTFTGSRAPIGAPSWVATCVGRRVANLPGSATGCDRLRGRVVWIQHEHPAGDVAETHLVVVERWHIRIVKIQDRPGHPKQPGLGSFITVVGPPVLGSHGETEVYAFRID
jgi:hypothetical protein